MYGSRVNVCAPLAGLMMTACAVGATNASANDEFAPLLRVTEGKFLQHARQLSLIGEIGQRVTIDRFIRLRGQSGKKNFSENKERGLGQQLAQAQDFQDQDFGQDQDFQDQDFGQDQDFQDQDVGQDQRQDLQGQDLGQGQTVARATGGRGLRQEALTAHNQSRAQHCVPPLAWSDQLAATAQSWANRCAFEHSSNGLGENLAIGTTGAFPPASQVRSWYNEINDYDFANGQSRTGQAVGHFTQVVWRSTTQVGCGVATCGGQDLLVCNYSPAGNFGGQYVQNVPQRCR